MSVRAQLNQGVASVSGSRKLFGEGVGEHIVRWAVQNSDVPVSHPFFERMNSVVHVL